MQHYQDPALLMADLQEALRQTAIVAQKYRQNPHYRLSSADREVFQTMAYTLRQVADTYARIGQEPII